MTGVVPTLTSSGAVARPWRDADVPFVLSVVDDPLIPLISTVPTTHDEQEALAFIARQHERLARGHGWAFAVTPTEEAMAVGYIGIVWSDHMAGRASIGYWLGPTHRRRGMTSAGVKAVAGWAIAEMGVPRLEAYIEPWNLGSIRVAEAAGFEREGLMRSWAPIGDERKDTLLYARIA